MAQCDKNAKQPYFRAYNSWPIGPDDRERTFRRVPTPVGQKCLIGAQILRAPSNWDGDESKLQSGEYQLLPHVEEP